MSCLCKRSNILKFSLKYAKNFHVIPLTSTVFLKRPFYTLPIKTVLKSYKLSKTYAKTIKQNCLFSDNVPNHIKVKLPALSPTMEMGTIVSWQKKEGDQISEGDLLCEIETDKATMGFETPEEGYLAKILIQEGASNIPVGQLMCIIVENKEDVKAFKDYSDFDDKNTNSLTSKKTAQNVSQKSTINTIDSSTESDLKKNKIKASPYAKKVAAETGIDLLTLDGSGPKGRILVKDVKKSSSHLKNNENNFGILEDTEPNYFDTPLSNMRQTIAKRLSESKNTIPHYYLTSEILIDELLKMRINLNNKLEKEAKAEKKNFKKLSINDFIIKASALSCMKVPQTNSFFMDTFIRQNNNVDVSVAVSTDSGLITPIVFGAHQKGLAAISSEISALACKAREGKLQPHEYQGGTFTVSNLGMFGSVDHFTAIINPPQSCILAIGGAKKKLIPNEENDSHQIVTTLNVTLSCDHRIVDGAVGALWLKYFKNFLQQPYTMLL